MIGVSCWNRESPGEVEIYQGRSYKFIGVWVPWGLKDGSEIAISRKSKN